MRRDEPTCGLREAVVDRFWLWEGEELMTYKDRFSLESLRQGRLHAMVTVQLTGIRLFVLRRSCLEVCETLVDAFEGV